VFTSRFLWRRLYSGTTRWSSPLCRRKEMCHVWEMDTSRPMDCGDTQQDRFRFLKAEISAREMAVVASYTQHGDKWAKPQYDRKHMVVNVTFPFTFVPVTDNDGRKCLFSHMKKDGGDIKNFPPPPPFPPPPHPQNPETLTSSPL